MVANAPKDLVLEEEVRENETLPQSLQTLVRQPLMGMLYKNPAQLDGSFNLCI